MNTFLHVDSRGGHLGRLVWTNSIDDPEFPFWGRLFLFPTVFAYWPGNAIAFRFYR